MFQEDQSASVKPKVYFTFYTYARDAYGVNFVIRTMCAYCTVMAKNIAHLPFCHKMQLFSQKIVAVANVLVLTCLFLLHWNNTKNSDEKLNLIPFHIEPKNALDKLLAPLT